MSVSFLAMACALYVQTPTSDFKPTTAQPARVEVRANLPGISLTFDGKGVDWRDWIKRFIRQLKKHWVLPLEALTVRGHSVVQFDVQADGRITDAAVSESTVGATLCAAALKAVVASDPTRPLPATYPADRAHFTLTFYYNESPAKSPPSPR